MITLVSAISATDRHMAVTGGTLDSGTFFRVDDELMFVHAYIDDPGTTRHSVKTADPYSWIITRAQGDTAAAAHLAGSTVTAVSDVWGTDVFATAEGGGTQATDPFVATDQQTEFALSETPIVGSVRPFVDGVRNGNWTLDTATVTFAVGVTEGAEVLIDYSY